MYYVYILKDGETKKLYYGYTNNLRRRIDEHKRRRKGELIYYEAYKSAGVTRVLNVVDILVRDIVHQVEKPDFERIAQLGNGAVEIFIVKIPLDAKVVGQTISEVASSKKLTEESVIAGIFDEKENEFKVPRGNTKIPGGADIFVITKPDLVDGTVRFLLKK